MIDRLFNNYLSSRTFSAVLSEYYVSFHSVPSRCHFYPFWACHLETKCTKWLTWAYPLCSDAFHTARLECAFLDLRRLRWLTAFDDVLGDWQRDAVELVETRISCGGTLVVYWVKKRTTLRKKFKFIQVLIWTRMKYLILKYLIATHSLISLLFSWSLLNESESVMESSHRK